MTRKSQKFLSWTSFGFKMIKTVFRICSLDTTQSRKPSRHISHDRCHVTGITTGRLCRLRFHINKFSGFHYITIFHWPTSTSHIPSHTISHTSSHTHHQSCTEIKIFFGFFQVFIIFFGVVDFSFFFTLPKISSSSVECHESRRTCRHPNRCPFSSGEERDRELEEGDRELEEWEWEGEWEEEKEEEKAWELELAGISTLGFHEQNLTQPAPG